MKNTVVVKSFPNGLALYLDEELEFDVLLRQVAEKFRESDPFFRDAALAVSFEGRQLSFEEESRLVWTIMDNSRLNITCIVGKDEESEKIYGRALDDFYRKQEEAQTTGQFYRGTLREGQMLETESSIIILGNVCQGSSVMAAGDIVVLGSLQGSAYAGGNGRPGHYIAALEMTPQKLKIGDFKYITEEKRRWPFLGKGGKNSHSNKQPQMAYVENGRIILKPITKESLTGTSL